MATKKTVRRAVTRPSVAGMASKSATAKSAKGESPKPVTLQRSASMATAQAQPRAVIYMHGLGNKPTQAVLRCQWDNALFGRAMGKRTRLAYWVNRDRYPTPEPGTCDDRDQGPTLKPAQQRVLRALGTEAAPDLLDLANAVAGTPAEAALLKTMLKELGATTPRATLDPARRGLLDTFNRILLRLISVALLQDVHDFFFDRTRREVMERSLLERMGPDGGPFVVISHSLGSVIAYEVLRKLDPARHDVALFVTLGSPLGLPSVRSMFKRSLKEQGLPKRDKLPFPACVRHWYNVADRQDPVALDGNLSDDIDTPGQRFSNLQGMDVNADSPRNPHSGSGYLSNLHVRAKVRQLFGPASASRFPMPS